MIPFSIICDKIHFINYRFKNFNGTVNVDYDPSGYSLNITLQLMGYKYLYKLSALKSLGEISEDCDYLKECFIDEWNKLIFKKEGN